MTRRRCRAMMLASCIADDSTSSRLVAISRRSDTLSHQSIRNSDQRRRHAHVHDSRQDASCRTNLTELYKAFLVDKKKCSEKKPRGTETNTKTLQSNNPTQARANMRQRSHPDRLRLCNLRNGILHPPSCICPLPQRVMNCAFSWPLITRQPPADRHHTSVISNRHAFSPI